MDEMLAEVWCIEGPDSCRLALMLRKKTQKKLVMGHNEKEWPG